MKVLAKLSLILMIALIMGGCATKGPSFSELAPSIKELPSNSGRIYLYRTTILGAALQPQIKLNGEPIGKSIARGFFYVDKDAGKYEVMTSTEVDRSLSFVLKEGQTRYVRFGVSMGFFVGHVYPELVSSEVAQNELLECKYTAEMAKNN